jgi:hypothetical protein
VYISQTAVLFHVVDQLSEWSYYSHRQYGRAFASLSDADRAMLEKHKTVRAKHPWGEGLEQTFYSPLALDEALAAGVAQGRLSSDEAATERAVLLHFAPRIEALLTAQAANRNKTTTSRGALSDGSPHAPSAGLAEEEAVGLPVLKTRTNEQPFSQRFGGKPERDGWAERFYPDST